MNNCQSCKEWLYIIESNGYGYCKLHKKITFYNTKFCLKEQLSQSHLIKLITNQKYRVATRAAKQAIQLFKNKNKSNVCVFKLLVVNKSIS